MANDQDKLQSSTNSATAPAEAAADRQRDGDSHTTDAAELPEWFLRRRRRRTSQDERSEATAAAPPPPPASERVVLEPPRPPSTPSPRSGTLLAILTSLLNRLRRGVGRFATQGVVVSLVFHATLLVIFSLIVLQSVKPNEPFSTLLSEADDQGTEIGDLSEAQLEMPDLAAEGVQLPQLQPVPIPTQQALRSAVVPDLQRSADTILESLLKAEGGGGDAGSFPNGGFKMPGSGNVVRKGSFVAWTVPQDPDPGEDYLIIIQVRLPRWVRNYNSRDLTGYMRGTDGYTTPIGFYRGRYYGKFNARARQLVIRIPGAEKNVRDTIHVESRLLREKQDLEIVF